MCGTPNDLSRSIVTPSSGLSLEATCPAGTPNVASLKKFGICDGAMCGAAVARFAYICNWSSLCGGRCLADSHSASCGASTRPLVPYGTNDAGGFRNILPPGTNGLVGPVRLHLRVRG